MDINDVKELQSIVDKFDSGDSTIKQLQELVGNLTEKANETQKRMNEIAVLKKILAAMYPSTRTGLYRWDDEQPDYRPDWKILNYEVDETGSLMVEVELPTYSVPEYEDPYADITIPVWFLTIDESEIHSTVQKHCRVLELERIVKRSNRSISACFERLNKLERDVEHKKQEIVNLERTRELAYNDLIEAKADITV